jgi:type IV pilus biogenesis protein CpaD/CtpE
VSRAATALIAVVALAGLAGCAEREQTAGGIKSDAAPFQGTNRPFVVTGWKPGDRASWESQLKVRTVQGQNDYAKVP